MPRTVHPLSLRTTVADMLNDGSSVKDITKATGLPQTTVYRFRQMFRNDDASYEASGSQRPGRVSLTRENLIRFGTELSERPKTTMSELLQLGVAEGMFEAESAPTETTVYRWMRRMGFAFRKVRTVDSSTKERPNVVYERQAFRKAQQDPDDNSLLIDDLLFFDESNFYLGTQPKYAWGTVHSPASLEQPKHKGMRYVLMASVGVERNEEEEEGGAPRAFVHWILVPPRKSFAPLPDIIQDYEEKRGERGTLRHEYTDEKIEKLGDIQLRVELNKIGVRSADSNKTGARMRDTLRSVARNGRVGERRARAKGRPAGCGAVRPAVVTARVVTEYFHQCLYPFLTEVGLWNKEGYLCEMSAEAGVRSCPDYGVNALTGDLSRKYIVMDSAKSHLPSTGGGCMISAMDKYVREELCFGGVVFTPPYSPKFNVAELLFSYLHRYVRKFAPTNLEDLVQRIREATDKVTGEMVLGWCKMAGYRIALEEKEKDGSEGVVEPVPPSPCEQTADARFPSRSHVACVTEDGRLMRHKPRGKRKWAQYKETDEPLIDISADKPGKRAPEPRAPPEAATRWAGLGDRPEESNQCETEQKLFTNDDDCFAVEAIIDRRTREDGKKDYLVRWEGHGEEADSWLGEEDFTTGLDACLREWQRNNPV